MGTHQRSEDVWFFSQWNIPLVEFSVFIGCDDFCDVFIQYFYSDDQLFVETMTINTEEKPIEREGERKKERKRQCNQAIACICRYTYWCNSARLVTESRLSVIRHLFCCLQFLSVFYFSTVTVVTVGWFLFVSVNIHCCLSAWYNLIFIFFMRNLFLEFLCFSSFPPPLFLLGFSVRFLFLM